jgi:glyceraldehyde 3-phosphate dehydrogenase
MAIRVAINGFGRIGRLVFRAMVNRPEFDIVAVNDVADSKTNAHLLKYDTVYGRFEGKVESKPDALVVNGKEIKIPGSKNEKGEFVPGVKDPAKLPWKDMNVEWVVESTGVFTTRADCAKHITAGAKRVLLSAPAKDTVDCTAVMGVNHETLKPEHVVISNASCTTNCLAPVAKVLNDKFKILRGLMTTVHAYTNDQRTADQVHKDLRRARAAAANIIPTSTGAAKAIGLVVPDLVGKLHGFALRVPVPVGSCVDLVCEVGRKVTKDEINAAMKEASEGAMKGFLGYTEDEIVSSDIVGDERSSIFDAKSTMVIGDSLIKILSWYDNEWGYSNRCADLIYYANTGKLLGR